ncbi:MAG: DUF4349 domain-containing protein [Bacilli bacterium]|nr:DUF4349 domain-containing protein [Bacilli bacterium]
MKKKGIIIVSFLLFIGLLSGCSAKDVDMDPSYDGNDGYTDVDTDPTPPTPTPDEGEIAGGDVIQNADIPALENRKIIYIANLTMDTTEPATIYNNVLDNLDTYSAYIESSNITATRYVVKIRVLSQNYNDFIEAIKETGNVVSFSNTSEDITNSYSTFEARKLALETQHARILELIAVAVDLEDILTLEEARSDIETELIQIGNSLANYDSLVDFSTINLTITKTSEVEVVLPKTTTPHVRVLETTKESISLEVYNTSDESVIIYVDVLQNGEFIRQYEEDAFSESSIIFEINDLKSFKEYTFKVSTIAAESRESQIVTQHETTEKTFFNKVTNTFVVSFNVLVTIIEYIGLAVVAFVPYILTAAIIFFPVRFLHRKYRVKYPKKAKEMKEIKESKENKEPDSQKRL